jgi:hypothetical protein
MAEPSDQEFEAVLSLPPAERYRHFLRKVVDVDGVWMAEDEKGLITVKGDGGEEVLPVWPARRYAEHAMWKWPDAVFVRVSVERWLEKTLLPVEDAADVALAVFPDSEGYGELVLVPEMIADLRAELGTRLDSLPGYDPDAEEIDLDALLKPAMKASMKAKPKGRLP